MNEAAFMVRDIDNYGEVVSLQSKLARKNCPFASYIEVVENSIKLCKLMEISSYRTTFGKHVKMWYIENNFLALSSSFIYFFLTEDIFHPKESAYLLYHHR